MGRSEPETSVLVERVLVWVLAARYPLTEQELLEAILIRREQQHPLSYEVDATKKWYRPDNLFMHHCAGLVKYDRSQPRKVLIANRSVQVRSTSFIAKARDN